ncbi:MAG: hypothetical protein ACTSUE_04930 [Promethearchaeota archaeon]
MKVNTIALVLHPTFFHFCRCLKPGNDGVIDYPEVASNLVNCFNNDRRRDYKIRYLLGDGRYKGIINAYHERGYEVTVVEENHFNTHFSRMSREHSAFDFQFSGSIPCTRVQELLDRDATVTGWAPWELGGKHVQAKVVHECGNIGLNLPRQVLIPTCGHLEVLEAEKILSWIPSDFMIVKSWFSSKSRMVDGSDYRVFHRSQLEKFIDFAMDRDGWFTRTGGVILSEFVETRDAHAGDANAVVHKVHVPTGLMDDYGGWSFHCQKIVANVRLKEVGGNIKPLGEIFRVESFLTGDLHEYRDILGKFVSTLGSLPCLYGIDIMVTPDGRLNFLELNKLAGTFGDYYSGNFGSPLEEYMKLITNFKSKNGMRVEPGGLTTGSPREDVVYLS